MGGARFPGIWFYCASIRTHEDHRSCSEMLRAADRCRVGLNSSGFLLGRGLMRLVGSTGAEPLKWWISCGSGMLPGAEERLALGCSSFNLSAAVGAASSWVVFIYFGRSRLNLLFGCRSAGSGLVFSPRLQCQSWWGRGTEYVGGACTVPNRTFESSEVLAAQQPMPH